MTSTASNNSAQEGTTGNPGQPTIAELPITDDEIFLAHVGGKLSVELRSPIDTQRDLSIAYTPGVAQVSRAIAAETATSGAPQRRCLQRASTPTIVNTD